MELEKIERVLTFVTQLIETKYGYWSYDIINYDDEPMWASNDPLSLDDKNINMIKSKTINCSGLINLIRRSLNLMVPGISEKSEYPGGTYEWYKYLKRQNVLHKFDYKKEYPLCTLFLRKYISEEDQGHLAILYEVNEKGSLYSKIIHSYSNGIKDENSIEKFNPGVNCDNTLGESHFYHRDGYYQYYCLPEDWLN